MTPGGHSRAECTGATATRGNLPGGRDSRWTPAFAGTGARSAEAIRDVIAFRKRAPDGDPLTGVPTAITGAQRKEAGIAAPLPA